MGGSQLSDRGDSETTSFPDGGGSRLAATQRTSPGPPDRSNIELHQGQDERRQSRSDHQRGREQDEVLHDELAFDRDNARCFRCERKHGCGTAGLGGRLRRGCEAEKSADGGDGPPPGSTPTATQPADPNLVTVPAVFGMSTADATIWSSPEA